MGQADDAIAFATSQLGKPYVFGAEGPNSWDCSGLIVGAYAAAKPPIHLVHFTGAMLTEGVEVARADLLPGDLVFPDSGHVQLYLGGNQVIEAPHSGANVRIVNMYGFWRGRRVASPGQAVDVAAVNTDGSMGVASPLSWVTNAGEITSKLIDPTFWKRGAMYFLGFCLIVAAVIYLSRHKIASAVGGVARTAGAVGGVASKPLEIAVLRKTLRQPDMPRVAPTAPVAPEPAPAPAKSTYKPRHYEEVLKVGERRTVAVSKGSKTYKGKRTKEV